MLNAGGTKQTSVVTPATMSCFLPVARTASREFLGFPRIDDTHALGAFGVGVGRFFLDNLEEEALDVCFPRAK